MSQKHDPALPIKVTKLDAALRQLRTSISLWFSDSDPVAIHALVFAAHELVHTLFRRQGLRGLLFDAEFIDERFRSEIAKALKQYATFFKHAQRDPDGEIEFHPKMNEHLILLTVNGLSRMGIPLGPEEMSFSAWFFVNNPHYYTANPVTNLLPIDILEQLRGIPKSEFFDVFSRELRKPKEPASAEHRRSLIIARVKPGLK